jgi:hypothetical protein
MTICAMAASAAPSAQFGSGASPPASELTFIVTADTHLGAKGMEAANRRIVDQMNRLPGKPWPSPLGGRVASPRGVLIAGDLTDNGTATEWRLFASLYGLTGRDGLLRFPVFEGTGNHDRRLRGLPIVPAMVARRHGSLLYAFTWEGVRFLNLDLYPSRHAITFMQKDLRKLPDTTPLVIYFHYNLVGPYSNWWSDREKKAFATALTGRNLLAMFHGHYHADGHYRWEGHQVYNVGSPRHSINTFCAVRVTETTMDVGAWDWDKGRFSWWHRTKRAPVTSRPAGAPGP